MKAQQPSSCPFSLALNGVLSHEHGQEIALLGCDQLELLASGQFLYRFALSSERPGNTKKATRALLHQLPFASRSIDCLVLWKTLSLDAKCYQQIHEASRVLRPEGRLLIVSQRQLPGLLAIRLMAEHCGLDYQYRHLVQKNQGSWWQRLNQVLPLDYLGYIAVFKRTESGLTPLPSLWEWADVRETYASR